MHLGLPHAPSLSPHTSKRFSSRALGSRTCLGALFALLALAPLGCGKDNDHDDDDGGGAGGGALTTDDPKYVIGSVVFSPEGETSYLNIVDDLEPQTLDYKKALELSGWADLWTHEGFLYVTSRENSTVTKYTISDANEFVEEGKISFTDYGEVDVAFWSNTFVAADKAYMINGTGNYVIWNPLTLEITGELELPELPEHEPYVLRAGTLDRANVIRDGKLYQPMYWSDADYAQFSPDSRVVVIDIATDSVEEVIDAPCAGLDIGTRDDAGNLYFSTWTSGVYEPLVLDAAPNCVAKIAAGQSTATSDFTFASVADGREGAAVRGFRDGRLLFSIFYDDQADLNEEGVDPWDVLGGANWRTWVYDPADGSAAEVDDLDWNSGATYVFPIDELHYVLVPSTDYATTTVVALDADLNATPTFDLQGWGTRLFKLR